MDADQDLIAEFVVESQEGLAHVETQMLAIEAAGSEIDVDLVNAVFRTMHSIKGAAGFLGLDRIGTLAHGLEELLNNLRIHYFSHRPLKKRFSRCPARVANVIATVPPANSRSPFPGVVNESTRT